MKYHKSSPVFPIAVTLLALCVMCAIPATSVAADTYPTKIVRLVIPNPPGGGHDVTGRFIATKLSEVFGKPVVLDYRPGATGIIGTEMVAKADPDGYTLLMIMPQHVTIPALRDKVPYDAVKAFAPIAMVGSGSYTLSVHPSVPANSVKELIALAKQKPGQLIFGCAGVGGTPHMATELFKIMADIDFKIVQFKGGGAVVVDLLGGHSNCAFNGAGIAVPHAKAGKLRLLATSGPKRDYPDVPTVGETLPGFALSSFWGVLAPAGTPAPIVERLAKEIKAIMATAEAKKVIEDQGSVVDYLGPHEFGKLLEDEITKYKMVVKKANIKMED
jgi:tripartite-type tricarboxylate transporter receptor subunit TctC